MLLRLSTRQVSDTVRYDERILDTNRTVLPTEADIPTEANEHVREEEIRLMCEMDRVVMRKKVKQTDLARHRLPQSQEGPWTQTDMTG